MVRMKRPKKPVEALPSTLHTNLQDAAAREVFCAALTGVIAACESINYAHPTPVNIEFAVSYADAIVREIHKREGGE